jgi:hypothetical protein
LGLTIATGASLHDQLILSQISESTVTQLIDSSRFTRDFSASAAQSGRELVNVGAPDWMQRESIRAILFQARKAGLSIEHQAVLLATAEIESGFNPMARAQTSTACGLFQFIRETGSRYELSPEQCMNPWLNAASGIEHYRDNLQRSINAKVTGLVGSELLFELYKQSYYLHHDGPNSDEPKNDVKAVVLNGTSYLFRSYGILERELSSTNSAPGFFYLFRANFLKVLDSIKASVVG